MSEIKREEREATCEAKLRAQINKKSIPGTKACYNYWKNLKGMRPCWSCFTRVNKFHRVLTTEGTWLFARYIQGRGDDTIFHDKDGTIINWSDFAIRPLGRAMLSRLRKERRDALKKYKALIKRLEKDVEEIEANEAMIDDVLTNF